MCDSGRAIPESDADLRREARSQSLCIPTFGGPARLDYPTTHREVLRDALLRLRQSGA